MDIIISGVTNVKVDADHDSEGILLPLSNGNILHIYRSDPGENGDHIGNTGKLVQRTFNTATESWGDITDFFNDEYDDRNVHGGVTSTGRLVVFFRRYNVTTSATVDNNFMYSDNDGVSWSNRATLTLGESSASPYGDMIEVPTKGYMMSFQTNYYLEVMFSADGSSWGDNVVIGDYITEESYNLTEAAFAYIGSGRIIGLVRDNASGSGDTLYQVTSDDYGDTWSTPVRTNIGCDTFIVSPRIIYYGEKIVILAPDRRSVAGDGNAEDEGICVYIGEPDVVYSHPGLYTDYYHITRPETTSTVSFYGYPAYTEILNGRYLVIFTDRHQDDTNEDTNLYQFFFELKITPTVGRKYSLPPFGKA